MPAGEVLDKNPFLQALEPADRDRVIAPSRLRAHARGERIWSEGEPSDEVSFVARGRVKLVRATEAGRDAIISVIEPGQALCAAAACAGVPHCCSGIAMEDAEILSLRRSDVLDVVERSPGAALELIRQLSLRVLELCNRVDELASGQAEQRVAKLLLRLALRTGVERPESGTWVAVPLSRQDVADLCGTTLETAIRTMSRLRKLEIVRTTARGFFVLDRARLEAIVHGAGKARSRRGPKPRAGRGQKG